MLISPSILSINVNEHFEKINLLEKLKVPYLHLDIMDGKFVPNKTYDAKYVSLIRPNTSLLLDTHLMIEHPEYSLSDFVKAGCDIITVHIEAATNIPWIIQYLHDHQVKCGLSLKPQTTIDVIKPYLKDIDLVLVMSVEPGFGGQKFISDMILKVKALNQIKKENNYHFLIEVDGGINQDNAKCLKEAGADILVVGTYLMNNPNIIKTYEELKSL